MHTSKLGLRRIESKKQRRGKRHQCHTGREKRSGCNTLKEAVKMTCYFHSEVNLTQHMLDLRFTSAWYNNAIPQMGIKLICLFFGQIFTKLNQKYPIYLVI